MKTTVSVERPMRHHVGIEPRMRHGKSWGAWVGLTVVVILFAAPGWAQTGHEEELAGLNERVVQLYQKGRYTEATEVAKAVLEKSEHLFGNNHPEVATALNKLTEDIVNLS